MDISTAPLAQYVCMDSFAALHNNIKNLKHTYIAQSIHIWNTQGRWGGVGVKLQTYMSISSLLTSNHIITIKTHRANSKKKKPCCVRQVHGLSRRRVRGVHQRSPSRSRHRRPRRHLAGGDAEAVAGQRHEAETPRPLLPSRRPDRHALLRRLQGRGLCAVRGRQSPEVRQLRNGQWRHFRPGGGHGGAGDPAAVHAHGWGRQRRFRGLHWGACTGCVSGD